MFPARPFFCRPAIEQPLETFMLLIQYFHFPSFFVSPISPEPCWAEPDMMMSCLPVIALRFLHAIDTRTMNKGLAMIWPHSAP